MYVESKKTLDKIRSKDEMMFRMAISHLMDVGIRHLTDENIAETCYEIRTRDDSHMFMTNEYMCELIIMAGDIAKVPHIDTLVYIQREVDYDAFDGGMSYNKMKRTLVNCLNWIEEDNLDTLDTFERIGLDDDDIEYLGFGYLLNKEEADDDEM